MTELERRITLLGPEKRDLLLRHLAQKRPRPQDAPIEPRSRQGARFPASSPQRRLWFLQQLAPDSGAYNLHGGLLLDGPLATASLMWALCALVDRHEALRTTFAAEDGEPFQVVAPPGAPLPVSHIDLGLLPDRAQASALARIVEGVAVRPFNLAGGPLLRVTLLRLAPARHALLLVAHHCIVDAWSMGILFRELERLYNAGESGTAVSLQPLAIQYPDFAAWQREQLGSGRLAAQRDYWRQRLEGCPGLLQLPLDRPRPAIVGSTGGEVPVSIAASVIEPLRNLARQHSTSLFAVLLAAFKTLLLRYTGQHDIVVGTPVAGRGRPELDGVVGLFVNTLALRTDLSGDPTFAVLIDRVSKGTLEAYDHQELPFDQIVEELRPDRDTSHDPLFQALFQLLSTPVAAPRLAGLRLAPLAVRTPVANQDLVVSLTDEGGVLSGRLVYRRDLFEPATARRLADHFKTLVGSVARDPSRRLSEIELFSDAERHQVLVEMNASANAEPHASVPDLFEAQVARTPYATAIERAERCLTYDALNRRANQLARHLQSLGAGPEVTVGLCVGRSWRAAVGMLAILKAGGTYLPLEASHPPARLAFMLADAKAALLVTERALASRIPEDAPPRVWLDELSEDEAPRAAYSDENLEGPRSAAAPAYVLYTSGSTGEPKGVIVPHHGIVNQLRWRQSRYQLDARDAVLQATSSSFDISIWDVLGPLVGGARLVLPVTDDVPDSAEIVRLVARHRVTVLQLVTSRLPAILEEPDLAYAGRLRHLILGGEPLTPDLQQRAFERIADAIDHLYGPTEASIDVTGWRCLPATSSRSIPIGRPIAGQRVYVLDEAMRPVPRGCTGELFVGGAGLARGYLRRPALTAERFVPDPFAAAGGRLYRTGDLVRMRSDGALEFQGRADTQVKVRGLRIELGEIEAAIARHPDVTAAAVAVWGDPQTDAMLVGYVAARRGTAPSSDEIRRLLRARLPEHMVPRAIVQLERLPLTAAGKVDRRALPPPPRPAAERVRIAPRGDVEQTIAGVWTELLHVGDIGRHDSFFDLGGHSLLATQMQSRLRDACGVGLSLRTLFDEPTVAGIAAQVEKARHAGLGVTLPPIRPMSREGLLPCAFEQRRLWFLDQLEPESALYNVPAALRCRGRLDPVRLARCVQDVVRRHESLRTTFVPGPAEPFQQVHPSMSIAVPLVDLRAVPAPRRDAIAAALVAREARRPFDLTTGPLLRVLLLHVHDDEQILFVNVHHIVCDGWSIGVLIRDLVALDAGFAAAGESPLPPLPVQYADFARWQRECLQGPVLDAHMAYWTKGLAGVRALELPFDRPRPSVPAPRGARRSRRVPGALWQQVVRLARASRATPFMALHAALSVLLYRYTRQSPIPIGVGVSHGSRAELEGVIGFFVNTIVLAADVSDRPSFRALLARVRESALEAYAHQDLPFEMVVNALRPEREAGVTPLFQVMLAMQDAPIPELTLQGLTLQPMPLDLGLSKFDLMLLVRQQGDDLQMVLEYRTALFDHTTAERLLAQLETLLARIVEAPDRSVDRLPLLGAAERHQILVEWRECERAAPIADATDLAPELFEDVARRMPAQPAVEQGGIVLGYGELSRRSSRLAHLLRELGVGPETRVALCIERSADLVVAMLAVLKAGGAYIPFDPTLPDARLRFMCEDAKPSVLIVRGSVPEWARGAATSILDLHEAERAAASRSDRAPASGVRSANLAYAIYTSGSTGVPKAVLVTHGGLANLVRDQQRRFGAGPGDASLQFASPSFDASVWEIWLALSCGARLVLAPAGTPLGGAPLADLLERHDITHAMLMTTTMGSLPARALPRLRVLFVGGEPVPPELMRQWAPGRRMFNVYGPTEATVLSTTDDEWRADRQSPPPIGRPLTGVSAYVLASDLEPLPIGAAGELCIGGAGVARGYLDRPALTAERFVPDPFGPPGSRLYRTGDRVRTLADGRIDFLGRLDHQIKLRGHRIELGEIEAALALHAGVARSVAGVRGRGADAALIAWWVSRNGGATTADDLRQFLRLRLPSHMIPAAFVRLEAMPVTSTGKLDRRALPDAVFEQAGERVPPRSELERTIAAVWRSVLSTDEVGVRDSFFDLGGHSLSMFEVHTHLKPLDPDLTLMELFEFPTIESLAAHLARRSRPSAPAPAPDQSAVEERGLRALTEGRARLHRQAAARDAAARGKTS